MINENTMKRVEEAYLKHLPDHFTGREDFKWKAIKHFQLHWDIEAEDFAQMLDRSLGKTESLLASGYYYARKMIVMFAKEDPEGTRAVFRTLYDESRDLSERVNAFIAYAEEKKQSHSDAEWKNTFQDLRAISVYLWLRYPDKYYLYKYGEVRPAAEVLGFDDLLHRTSDASNMIKGFRFYDEVHDHIVQNKELIDLYHSLLSDKCYPDPQYRTLACDVVFYISRYYGEDEWYPADYHPGFGVEDWLEMMKDPDLFFKSSLTILKRLKDYGGQATCTQLSDKYGETKNWYNGGSSSLGKRIAAKTGCPTIKEDSVKYWTILYVGKRAPRETRGSYIWKLRPELAEALEQMDLSDLPLYSQKKLQEMGESSGTEMPDSGSETCDFYSEDDFLSEVFMEKDDYQKLKELLLRKKNVILQGAPGVGKTFAAKRLAYSIMGMRDTSRVAMIQFHQNYTYEDFIMGYKPDGADFALKTGIFYDFCEKARMDPEKPYFFIIDEINRGNMSKIFGELLQLIESDYRDEATLLAYTHELFSVPSNLYLIGMMNTADRSLALIDYALRRRFSFYQMEPAFAKECFQAYQSNIGEAQFDSFVSVLIDLNKEIEDDPTLGGGFRIGHSYLCLGKGEQFSEDWLYSVMEYDILPTLQEYWFDDKGKVEHWETEMRKAINV